ncbi:Hypothetical predicted protein [Olea europaea subsp. europaea]|uniref:Splicing factor YJU2 n=1 Tax=Olea europaea subsp. europaea TaxID=158383 RepID=A0A8S0UT75_OLEEU|nr:Hypothetical predicted protein [Olea europaea subsp. europaea]
MGERKVLDKYYPLDFDPAKIPCRRQQKNQQIKVRMMLPMSIRCGTCGNYIYKGTNLIPARKMSSEKFYFKCTKCSAEITVKTDLQNSDYTIESGATRISNLGVQRMRLVIDEEKKKRNSEEMGDAMKSLENRTLDSKREMDILAALDEMKSMKMQHSNETKKRKLEEEDEALMKAVFKPAVIRRIDDEDIDDDEDFPMFPFDKEGTSADHSKVIHKVVGLLIVVSSFSRASTVTVSILKKPHPDSNSSKPAKEKPKNQEARPTAVASSGLQSLCQQYGSDEDD